MARRITSDSYISNISFNMLSFKLRSCHFVGGYHHIGGSCCVHLQIEVYRFGYMGKLQAEWSWDPRRRGKERNPVFKVVIYGDDVSVNLCTEQYEDQFMKLCNFWCLILQHLQYLGYIAQNSKMMNWKGFGRMRSWPNQGTFLAFAWKDWGKLRKKNCQDIWCASRHSNNAPTEYKSIELPPEKPANWKLCRGIEMTLKYNSHINWRKTMMNLSHELNFSYSL
jgi:hypothetical protein